MLFRHPFNPSIDIPIWNRDRGVLGPNTLDPLQFRHRVYAFNHLRLPAESSRGCLRRRFKQRSQVAWRRLRRTRQAGRERGHLVLRQHHEPAVGIDEVVLRHRFAAGCFAVVWVLRRGMGQRVNAVKLGFFKSASP